MLSIKTPFFQRHLLQRARLGTAGTNFRMEWNPTVLLKFILLFDLILGAEKESIEKNFRSTQYRAHSEHSLNSDSSQQNSMRISDASSFDSPMSSNRTSSNTETGIIRPHFVKMGSASSITSEPSKNSVKFREEITILSSTI